MLVVGLTGSYGMGKSTVLGMFGKLGAATLEADGIVDDLLHEKPVLERLRKILGNEVLSADGELDRTRVATAIFQNEELRGAVEKVLHPLVFERINVFLENLGKDVRIAVIEIPLLFETDSAGRFDRTITVFTDEDTALGRLRRSGVGKEDAMMRLRAQAPVQEKIAKSDYAIDNSGPLLETAAQVAAVYDRLLKELKDKNGHHQRA